MEEVKGHDAFIILGMMTAFYLTVSSIGSGRLEEFVDGPGFYSWLVIKNVLTWFAFLALGVYIGRLQRWNNSRV